MNLRRIEIEAFICAVRTAQRSNSRAIREKNDMEVITFCCVVTYRIDENSIFTLVAHRSSNNLQMYTNKTLKSQYCEKYFRSLLNY